MWNKMAVVAVRRPYSKMIKKRGQTLTGRLSQQYEFTPLPQPQVSAQGAGKQWITE
jgi:hypothetical protein